MSETTLTLLYTATIDGRLDAMPHMMTLIRRERARVEGPVLLLDGGGLCSIEVWPCAVTRMRAGRTMLEAMGYDAAALAGSDLLPLGGLGAGSEVVLAEMAGHGMVPALNASFGWVPNVLSTAVVERGGLRIGLTADWRSPAEDAGGMQEGSALARPDPDALSRAVGSLRDAADLTILMTLTRPAERVQGVDIELWPVEAQIADRLPALLVRQYAVKPAQGVGFLDEKVVVCDDGVPQEPTIAAVLELVVEEAARLRGG